MKKIFSSFFVLLLWFSAAAQDIQPGPSQHLERASTLILGEQFASAHDVLENALREIGFHPDIVCALVGNIIDNHLWHRDFQTFYMTDQPGGVQIEASKPIVAAHFPDHYLKKLIRLYPQDGRAYRLMGDFFQLQSPGELLPRHNSMLQEDIIDKIYRNYSRAAQLGQTDVAANRWLGSYFILHDQPRVAKKHFLRTIDAGIDDSESYYRLGEIHYAEKKYSQGYNFAMKALLDESALPLRLRFSATRLAGLSLYQIGEYTRFIDYIEECISLMPDQHAPYVDLCRYYEDIQSHEEIQACIAVMLMRNPYAEEGYRYLESYVVKYDEFAYAERICDDVMQYFEFADKAMGNIYLFRGNLMYHRGNIKAAEKLWGISRSYLGPDVERQTSVLHKADESRRTLSE